MNELKILLLDLNFTWLFLKAWLKCWNKQSWKAFTLKLHSVFNNKNDIITAEKIIC
jgi:hypothetical protein